MKRTLARRCIGAYPALLCLATEGWVDNETTEGVDQRHVERGETTHWLHIDRQVERVALRARDEGERQEAMDSRITEFAEGFGTEDVEHSKRTLASSRRHLGLGAIGCRKTMNVRHRRRVMATVIPSKRSAQDRPQPKQLSNRHVGRWSPVTEQDRARVLDGAAWAPAIERNRPDVVERHVAEKRVAAQVESSELSWTCPHDQFLRVSD